jgi:hypothetical protein
VASGNGPAHRRFRYCSLSAERFANWNPPEGKEMLDIAMIVVGVGFFAASILYVLACERM